MTYVKMKNKEREETLPPIPPNAQYIFKRANISIFKKFIEHLSLISSAGRNFPSIVHLLTGYDYDF